MATIGTNLSKMFNATSDLNRSMLDKAVKPAAGALGATLVTGLEVVVAGGIAVDQSMKAMDALNTGAAEFARDRTQDGIGDAMWQFAPDAGEAFVHAVAAGAAGILGFAAVKGYYDSAKGTSKRDEKIAA